MSEKKRVLVIDDEAAIQKLLKLELADQGYAVETSGSAIQGLQILKKECFDAVILDIKMPGMDGIEALEKIISTQKGLPVIIHSAFSHFRENYRTWSAVAYVVKSGNLDELLRTVNETLKNKTNN